MSGIGGLNFGMVTMGTAGIDKTGDKPGAKSTGNPAVDDFLAYMKKSLAERMADAWLASHGLDREKLKAMKPEDRAAVLKQMAEDLKKEMQEAAAEKAKAKPDAA